MKLKSDKEQNYQNYCDDHKNRQEGIDNSSGGIVSTMENVTLYNAIYIFLVVYSCTMLIARDVVNIELIYFYSAK